MVILLRHSIIWLVFYLRFRINTFFSLFFYSASCLIWWDLVHLFWFNRVKFLKLKLRLYLIFVIHLICIRFDDTFFVQMNLLLLRLNISSLHSTILYFQFQLHLSLFKLLYLFRVIFNTSDKRLVCLFIVLFEISYLCIQCCN